MLNMTLLKVHNYMYIVAEKKIKVCKAKTKGLQGDITEKYGWTVKIDTLISFLSSLNFFYNKYALSLQPEKNYAEL